MVCDKCGVEVTRSIVVANASATSP
jgi:hypothetical protein